MTREEYDIKIENKKYSLQQQKDRFVAYYHIGKSYIKSLEQRIKELEEPNSCEGCMHIQWINGTQSYACKKGVSAGYISRVGTPCVAKDFYCSYYEPKGE